MRYVVRRNVFNLTVAVNNGAYSTLLTVPANEIWVVQNLLASAVSGDRPMTIFTVEDPSGLNWNKTLTPATSQQIEPVIPYVLDAGWRIRGYFTGGTTDGNYIVKALVTRYIFGGGGELVPGSGIIMAVQG